MFLPLLALIGFSATAQAQTTWGVTAGTTGASGLYNSSGTLVDSSVSVSNSNFTLTYNDSIYTSGGDTYVELTPGFQTCIYIKYSNSNWTSAPNSAVVGVQVVNAYYDSTSGDYIQQNSFSNAPTVSNLITVDTGHRGPLVDLSYTDVHPNLFQVNSGAVYSGDSTGDTAVYVYNPSLSAPYPWYSYSALEAPQDTTLGMAWGPVMWCFPQPTQDGVASAGPNRPFTVYPV